MQITGDTQSSVTDYPSRLISSVGDARRRGGSSYDQLKWRRDLSLRLFRQVEGWVVCASDLFYIIAVIIIFNYYE